MPYMPDVYVSGDRMWESMTYGSDNSAFIIIGTALLNNFRGDDLLYLLARELGHCRAGHALWKTVSTFLLGQQGPRKGMMAGGLLNLLDVKHLVEGASRSRCSPGRARRRSPPTAPACSPSAARRSLAACCSHGRSVPCRSTARSTSTPGCSSRRTARTR